ncbi:MAG: helix-turn-helix domain-containing protein [Angustibacter sp.]
MSARTIEETMATLRKAAGLTQRQLASRANVSMSLLSKVEVGDRAASPALISAVSRALGVPDERLEDHRFFPKEPSDQDTPVTNLRAALRALAFARTDSVPAPSKPRTLPEVSADMGYLSALRRSGRYAKLAAALPALLYELSALGPPGHGDARHHGAVIDGLYLAHSVAHRLGHPDLAGQIDLLLSQAAEDSADPFARALARWNRVTAYQSGGDYARGLAIVTGALRELPSRTHPDAITLRGSLHLRAVTLAARAGDRAETASHLDAARVLATGLSRDLHRRHLTFGPVNIAIHELASAVDLCRPDHAIALAEGLELPADLSATRAGHFYLDLARAHVAKGSRTQALAALEQARLVAPEHTRLHPRATETTRALISLQRRANPQLSRFSAWLGLFGS